jgi:deoxyadenosine/deoxycytidine kinase
MQLSDTGVVQRKETPLEIDIINIEGNIASCKSTLLQRIETNPVMLRDLLFEHETQEYAGATVLLEPIEKWMSVGPDNTDLLGNMYSDPAKYGLACQLNIAATQFQATLHAVVLCVEKARLVDPCKTRRVLLVRERSPLSSREVFARALLDRGHWSSAEWTVYCNMHDQMAANFDSELNKRFPGVVCRTLGTVVLITDIDSSMARLRHRARPAEDSVDVKLLQDIGTRHHRLFISGTEPNAPGVKLIDHQVIVVNPLSLMAVLAGKVGKACLFVCAYSHKKSAARKAPGIFEMN